MTGVSKVRHETARTPGQIDLLRWIAAAPLATPARYQLATGINPKQGRTWGALEAFGLIETPSGSSRSLVTPKGARLLAAEKASGVTP